MGAHLHDPSIFAAAETALWMVGVAAQGAERHKLRDAAEQWRNIKIRKQYASTHEMADSYLGSKCKACITQQCAAFQRDLQSNFVKCRPAPDDFHGQYGLSTVKARFKASKSLVANYWLGEELVQDCSAAEQGLEAESC